MIEHMYKADGKKIRPILMLLTAKALGEVNDSTYHAAVILSFYIQQHLFMTMWWTMLICEEVNPH